MASQTFHTTSHLRIASTPPFYTTLDHLSLRLKHHLHYIYPFVPERDWILLLAFLITTAPVCLFRCAAAHHDYHHHHRH